MLGFRCYFVFLFVSASTVLGQPAAACVTDWEVSGGDDDVRVHPHGQGRSEHYAAGGVLPDSGRAPDGFPCRCKEGAEGGRERRCVARH